MEAEIDTETPIDDRATTAKSELHFSLLFSTHISIWRGNDSITVGVLLHLPANCEILVKLTKIAGI